MKVLIVSDVLSYGGASKLINDMVPILNERGCKCDLLIWTDHNAKYIDGLRNQGITVDVIPKKDRNAIATIMYVKKYIKHGNYDVVHVNLFPMLYYCSIAKRLLGKKAPKFIYTEHSTDNKRRHKKYLKPLERIIYKKYDHVVSISEKAQENIIQWLKPVERWKTQFSVIENGIYLEQFRNATSYDKKRLMSDYTEEIFLLMVGSFTEQKNHKFILQVINKLSSKYYLFLAGEGPLQENIRNEAKRLGILNRVIFLGFRKDIASLMKSVDIVVIPSKWEGFGLIAAEAMAAGTPIVASKVPGLAEVVADAGELVEPGNVDGFCDAITKLEDEKLKRSFCIRGRARSTQFDIDRVASLYEQIYEI